jgi:hypothetical protein
MYPREQLSELAARKELLRLRIGVQRARCQLEMAQLLPPLRLADAAWQRWRTLLPLLKWTSVPLGVWLAERRRPARSRLQRVLSWAPFVLRAMRFALCRPAAPRNEAAAPLSERTW